MGFHITIDDESERLIRLIRADPSQLFRHLYSAYILFLVGERDVDELKWLLDHAKALDSLTGQHVAYAVFAKRFNVRLQTHRSPDDRTAQNVGEVTASEVSNVTRLVKEGRFGVVVDGDEVTAITYGTDIIARELGLIDRLPCIVLVDAVPSDKLSVIVLDSDVTQSLMALLHKAIGRFAETGGDLTIRGDAERLLQLQHDIEDEKQRGASLQAALESAGRTIARLRDKIASGRAMATLTYLESILTEREAHRQSLISQLDSLPEEQPARLRQLEQDLVEALKEHARHNHLRFSHLFEEEVRAMGLDSKIRSAKAETWHL